MSAPSKEPSVQEDELSFDPLFPLRTAPQRPQHERDVVAHPDSRAGAVYRMMPELHLAVEVALTTGRPLLLRGDPGTGKSSLAPYVARVLGWRFYDQVVTSTSTSNDLLWRFDAVKRLSDAQAAGAEDERHYLRPGVIWWALNRTSALDAAKLSGAPEPGAADNGDRRPDRAVVLIDEIDKAHPDLPNGLLVTLGANEIPVPYLPDPIRPTTPKRIADVPSKIEIAPVLFVVTTNEERELPPAFVRRCITFQLRHPDPAQLVEIARTHFDHGGGEFRRKDERLATKIAARVDELRKGAVAGVHKPSTAEFLDAFRACRHRGITPDSADARWRLIEQVALVKSANIGSR